MDDRWNKKGIARLQSSTMPNRNEIAFISQKLLLWKPRYQIIIDDAVFAEVIKEWT